jgi:hypothetical protein
MCARPWATLWIGSPANPPPEPSNAKNAGMCLKIPLDIVRHLTPAPDSVYNLSNRGPRLRGLVPARGWQLKYKGIFQFNVKFTPEGHASSLFEHYA